MIFTATEEQVQQIIFNAIKHSKPFTNSIGVQYLFEPFKLRPEDIKVNKDTLYFDYVLGRCVKLFIYRIGIDRYEIQDEPTFDRQTWICKYPTNAALVNEVIKKNDSNT
jgi:hypothetical protein